MKKPLPIPLLAAAMAAAASAATYTVSQDGRGSFSSIQAAVDKAQPYDEVVILDSAIYNEQVTLRSPLHHFTLRSADPSSPRKPVIRWSDQADVGPKTCAEALDTAKITFDKNGALRLIDVRDARIEGIAVDGAGPMPFNNMNVWGNGKDCSGNLYPLFHGNAALVVYRSSQVVLIGCELANAYFGAYIKDNEGEGPYFWRGTTPGIAPFARLSSGNHFFAGNSIHHNTWGVFMESAWGLGSTFRDNLIYENHHATPAAAAAVKAMFSEGANQPGGAFLFKDVQFSPMTLQNNTFWRDYLVLAGGYRPGAQHLIVDNLIAEPNVAWSQDPVFPNHFMSLDPYFTKRMKCNAYAGQMERPILDSLHATANAIDPATRQEVSAEKMVYSAGSVRIMNGFPAFLPDTSSTLIGLPLSTGVQEKRVPLPAAVYFGALLQGSGSPFAFSPADGNIWLEPKFRSVQPADPGFLLPDTASREFLKADWPPLRYPGTSAAGLGARPASARPSALLRIIPFAPVLIEDGRMVLRFSVQMLKGGPASGADAPVISYLRMERNLQPHLLGFGGSSTLDLPEADSIPVPAIPIRYGYNEVKLPPPGLSPDSSALGFVEMAVQGLGALSNVATFPILPLAPLFTVEALDETQDVPAAGFAKGKTFRLRIAYARTPAATYPVRITLASGAALKYIDPAHADSAGSIASPLPFTARVQFTEAPEDGVELIWAAAFPDSRQTVTGFGQSRPLVFDGTPSRLARGRNRFAPRPADVLKRRNVMGRRVGMKGP